MNHPPIKPSDPQHRKIAAILLLALACLIVTTSHSKVEAQVRVGVSFQTYSPPAWAPPYDNVSTTEYYYFPDYEMYYDVWTGQFWYPNGSEWIPSDGVPPQYAGIDLSSAYIVLIDRHVQHPWYNHSFYVENYPRHSYEGYRNIVVNNRIVTNIEPNHELVPRAYNENNHRVTFQQHPTGGGQPRDGQPRDGQPRDGQPGGGQQGGGQQSPAYHRVAHEVPIRTIAPSMPKEARSYNYGGASNRPSPSRPAPPAPAPHDNGQRGGPQGGGRGQQGGNQQQNSHGGGGNNKH